MLVDNQSLPFSLYDPKIGILELSDEKEAHIHFCAGYLSTMVDGKFEQDHKCSSFYIILELKKFQCYVFLFISFVIKRHVMLLRDMFIVRESIFMKNFSQKFFGVFREVFANQKGSDLAIINLHNLTSFFAKISSYL